jgi:hypothetical protein
MFKPPLKKGTGAGRVLPIASISNQPGGMMNKYVPGSGVGASSVAVRRLKLYKATQHTNTVPDTNQPTTVPDPPTIRSLIVANGSVSVFFSAPSNNGGSTITSYRVFSNPGGIEVSGTSSPITVTGLTNGTTYTFTMVATNVNGDSAVSNTSDDAVPDGAPQLYGQVKSVVSFYDNANLGYIIFNNTFSKMCVDDYQNVIIASYARSGTFTINKTDAIDGITQTPILTDTFIGTPSVSQGINTYYTYNIEIIKYDSDGSPQWVAKIGGDTNKANTIYDIVTDSNDGIYVLVGHGGSTVTYYNSDGTIFGTLNNSFQFGNFTSGRYCLIKYTSDGYIQWINTITAGDNNNQTVLLNTGNLVIDNNYNICMTCQVQRAGGGSGPTTIKFYEYTGVDSSNQIQFTLTTSDSYPFNMPYVDGQWQRGFLIKINPNNNYEWIARMVIPGAYGEQNSGPMNKNIVIDTNNDIYVCLGTISSASSPICNIYSAVSTSTNPLSALAAPYYRLDLRGNSLTPSAPQYYKFAAILKFNNNGIFQRASCVHQLHKSSVILDMNPYIGIDKTTNSLYLSMNAQGFDGTNAMSGAQLNKLYVNNFSANNANASNYDIIVTSAYTMTLAQPQSVIAIVKYNSSLQAQTMAYIDTPGGNSVSPVAVDSAGNVYITTTIRDNTTTKKIYVYNSLSGSNAVFDAFANINATSANTDGLVVCYSGDLTNVLWGAPITSSDGLNNSNFINVIDNYDNIYIGGTASLNKDASSNFVNLYNYNAVSGGYITNSLFGNMDVTNAVDRVGFVVKYQ